MPTPTECYQQALQTLSYFPNPEQAQAVDYLQAVYEQLQAQSFGLKRWLYRTKKIQGLYLWGGVGVGKTWLMDLFFESIPFKQKWRCHFHDFMLKVHAELQHFQGKINPLDKIAKKFSKKAKLLCFDEFFVSDIGDAMILGNLLQALFREGVVIVTTSNVAPDNLYQHGLQRARFLPTISILKKQLKIFHLPTQHDYRKRVLEQAEIFFSPLTLENLQHIKTLFTSLAKGDIHLENKILLYDRPIKTVAFANNIIWFDFKTLCSIPRNQADYLSIAERWPIIIITDLHQITAQETGLVKSFIHLIDILYDKKIMLILTSEVALNNLYLEGNLSFEFRRTLSRLHEMQSTAYLAQMENTPCKK